MKTLALAAHSLRRSRGMLIAACALLGGFQVVMVLAARTLQENGAFAQLAAMVPPFVRVLAGPAIVAMMSFAGVASIGYFHVAVTAATVVIAVALCTEVATEIETGFADLVYARPIARQAAITRSVIVLASAASLIVAAMLAGTWVGLLALAPDASQWPTSRLLWSLALNVWALTVCWGGLAMAFAACSRRRSVSAATCGFVALALFLADYVGRLWKPANTLGRLSPFRYASGVDLVMGQPLSWSHVGILLGTAVAGILLAYLLFWRRDI